MFVASLTSALATDTRHSRATRSSAMRNHGVTYRSRRYAALADAAGGTFSINFKLGEMAVAKSESNQGS